MRRKTSGDISSVECPACGKRIRDLWDYSGLSEGDVISCPHCERDIEVCLVDTVTFIDLAFTTEGEEVPI